MTQKFSPRKDIAYRKIQGEMVLVDPAQNLLLRLNETATFIWERLESIPVDQIVQEIADTFDTEVQTAAADTKTFIELLSRKSILVVRETQL